MSELDDLARILKAREGKPGMAANVAMIKERIAALQISPEPPLEESLPPPTGRYRDAVTGEYVTAEYAAANPATTVRETDS